MLHYEPHRVRARSRPNGSPRPLNCLAPFDVSESPQAQQSRCLRRPGGFFGWASHTTLPTARAPSSFVIKFAAAAEAAVGLDDTFAYKEMEAQFYRDLALDAGLPVPQLYYDFLDSESKRSALLLQDVIHGQTGDDAGRLLGAGGARHITATGSIPRPVVGESQTGASGMAAPDVRSVQSCAPTTRPCSTPE